MELSFKNFKPKLTPALERALRDSYQLSIEDVGFTDVLFQEPIASTKHPHSRWNEAIDISGYVTKSVKLRLPVASSSMPGVTNYEIATKIGEAGGLATLSREDSIEELEELIKRLWAYKFQNQPSSPWFAGAVGVYPRTGPAAIERVDRMVKLGVEVLFIETQQANSALVLDFCRTVKNKYSKLEVVVGVFNSVDGVKRAIESGADGVKVGIGTGDACLTTTMSGVTKGQVNTVFELADYMSGPQAVPVVVDGGTSSPGGAAIMMAALKGHGCIMLGSKIAATLESPAAKIHNSNNGITSTEAVIEGMGSEPIAARRNEPKNQRILEGTVVTRAVVETIGDLLLRYEGGFRTAMYGYHGALSWQQLADRAALSLNSPANVIARYHDR